MALAARAAHTGPPLDGSVRVKCLFTFARPKRHRRANGDLRDDAPWWHGTRPDVDKLCRAILDAITGIVIGDDGQVCELVAGKVYGDEPGAHVMVWSTREAA